MRYLILFLSAVLVGCSGGPYSGATVYSTQSPIYSDGAMTADQAAIREALEAQYQHWQGVPYRLGGNSRAGIDCSGFTQTTYQERFNRSLPRTTEAQARVGTQVGAESLAPGDLVFFKTAVKVRHVGIYMGRGEFLHASTSRGVMVSRLSNPYWSQNYWQARRLY